MWLLTALFSVTLGLWTTLSPIDVPNDETAHADLSFHLAEGEPWPEYDGRDLGTAVRTATVIHRPPDKPRTPERAPDRSERLTFEGAGGDAESTWVQANQMTQHGPLYYQLMGRGLRIVRAVTPEMSLDREWHVLRFFNVALVTPLPVLAWATTRRIGGSPSAAIAAAAFPLAIPQLTHIGAAINNDNLLVLLGGVLAVLLAGVVRGDDRRRTAVAVGVVIGLALLTKAFALALAGWVAIAYASSAWRRRDRLRSHVLGLVLAGTVAMLVGGWWWVRNLVRVGELAPTVESTVYTTRLRPPGFSPDPLWWAGRFVVWMVERFWGVFGWILYPQGSDARPISAAAIVLATAVAVVALVAAFAPRRWRVGIRALADVRASGAPSRSGDAGVSRASLLAFGSVLPLLVLLVASRAWDLYTTTGGAFFIHGRYLFAGIAALAVAIGVGLGRLLGRAAPLAMLAGALVMQLEGIRVALDSWWSGSGTSVHYSLAGMRAWNPWFDHWPTLLMLLAAALVLLTGWDLAGRALGGRRVGATGAIGEDGRPAVAGDP